MTDQEKIIAQLAELIEVLNNLKSSLSPFFDGDFYSLLTAFFLIVLFWLGFLAGSKSNGI